MDTQTTAPHTPADRAGTVGHETTQATKDVAATAGQEAQRTAREAKDQVRHLIDETRSDLVTQASAQQARAAAGLRELAEQLGSMAGSTDRDGMARGLVDDAARRAGDAAAWLDQRDPGSILEEARTFARRRPGAFLAIAAGVGVVAGRLSRSLVDEARDESGPAAAAGTGSGTPAGNGVTDAGMPSATSPTRSTTSSVPVTPGAAPGVVDAGSATVPSGDLPGAHRSTQPMAPDGTPMPIGPDGHLTVEDDEAVLRGER